MGRGNTPAREISFVSLVAYGPKVCHSALAMGVTASETRQGISQQFRREKMRVYTEIVAKRKWWMQETF